jgi:hypothetical protein
MKPDLYISGMLLGDPKRSSVASGCGLADDKTIKTK